MTEEVLSAVKQYGIRIIEYLVVLLVGMGIGIMLAYNPKEDNQPNPPKAEVKTQTKTSVQYIPKSSPRESDVEIKQENPTVSVNGKKYQFEKLPEESAKFEKGKLEVTQRYNVSIDAKSLVPKRPKWGADVGLSNHGYTVGLRYNANRNVSFGVKGTPAPREGKDHYYEGYMQINF